MMKKRRNIRTILMAVAMLFVMIQPIIAQSGRIEITLKTLNETSDKATVSFQLYRIGDVSSDGTPTIDQTYEEGKLPSDAESLDALAKKLSTKVTGSPKEEKKTNAQGKVDFQNLEKGVYLITTQETNSYGTISPFIVCLPYYEEVNGVMSGPTYDIQVEPKATAIVKPVKPIKPIKPVKPSKPTEKPIKPVKPNKPTEKPTKKPSESTDTSDRTKVGSLLGVLLLSGCIVLYIRKKKEA